MRESHTRVLEDLGNVVGRRFALYRRIRRNDHLFDVPSRNELGQSIDELLRFDVSRGTAEVHRFPGWAIGEAVFAPKTGRTDEEGGYILTFATNLATMESTFVILDAEDFAGEPVAVVKLPRRVPLGLHGNWYPSM